MACFFNMVVVLVMVGSIVMGQVKVDKDDNIEPFALLCRIYNVAKNPPINPIDLQQPLEILQEIDALNTSLVEPKLPNETEQMGDSWEAKLTSAVTKETLVTQLSLNQITQRAHKILEDISKINVTKEIEKAKAEFDKVIFGGGGNEDNLCQATVNDMDNRSKACGPPGLTSKGESAGKNLVVDFFCLCAQRTVNSEGADKVCGFYVGRVDEHYGWGEQGPWGSSTMWASIKGGCGKHMQQRPKSTSEARHILDQFLKHLKTGGVYRWGENSDKVEGSERKEGMLGTSVGKNGNSESEKGPVCNGREAKTGKPPGGVCVYYGQESEGWEGNIDWLKIFQTALVTVDYINKQTASIQRNIDKLQMLLHRAEEIYETTKVISEIQNIVVTSAFQNVTGNLTAQNTTRTRSYSYNPNSYFIPPWVLLILS